MAGRCLWWSLVTRQYFASAPRRRSFSSRRSTRPVDLPSTYSHIHILISTLLYIGGFRVLCVNCNDKSATEIHITVKSEKKLCYRRRTARRAVSVKILSTAAQQCRNDLYSKSADGRRSATSRTAIGGVEAYRLAADGAISCWKWNVYLSYFTA